MYAVTQRFEFDAGHRIIGHEGKCKYLHGHHYIAEITIESKTLNDLDMVVDFSAIKARVGKWIDDNWDHNFLLFTKDPLKNSTTIHGREFFIMPQGFQPTAEAMARVLYDGITKMLEDPDPKAAALWGHLRIIGAKVWETPKCAAAYHSGG
jgi:6-pyruvoyltetrahydropterin/6-carboxytetrahydropterin synthase